MTFPELSSDRLIVSLDPYARQFTSASHTNGHFVNQRGGFEIEDVAFDGTTRRVQRSSHVDLTLTGGHREAFADWARDFYATAMQPADMERELAAVEYPERIPAMMQLLEDSEGNLWARHYKLTGTPGPETWTVYAPEGYLLGTLETPERLQVRQIGPDYLLGIWTDELEVRYVRKYAIEKP